MTNYIKSLFGYEGSKATPEEAEAYRIANEALQYRVQKLSRQEPNPSASLRPITDAYGRSIQ
jgi:hypothetical protein